METLEEQARYRGTSYKAVNWIHFGSTQGCGRKDRDHAAHGRCVKDIFFNPLCRHTQDRLRNAVPPVFVETEEPDAFVLTRILFLRSVE
jgi:hypothetical protein